MIVLSKFKMSQSLSGSLSEDILLFNLLGSLGSLGISLNRGDWFLIPGYDLASCIFVLLFCMQI